MQERTPLMTLIDVVVTPNEAFRRSFNRFSWLIGALALLMLVILGGTIQAPVAHHQSAIAVQQAVAHGSMGRAEQEAIVAQAANPPFSGDLLNFGIYFIIMLAGIAAEAGLATAFAVFASGTPNYKRLFSAMIYISVWTVGLYYVLLSVIMRLAFTQNPSATGLDAVFPSALTAFSGANSSFSRGALASINPFLLAALWLHAVMMQVTGGVGRRPAYLFSIVLLVIEVLVSGALVTVLG
jgi:hypothetical protein